MKPSTRREMFLDAIADGTPCSLEPVTREERALQEIAESAGGSGSGGGGVKHMIYAKQYNTYLYHDVDCTKKVSATELDEMMNSGTVLVTFDKGDTSIVCFLISYNYSPEWGSMIRIAPENVIDGFYTSEYVEEG